MSKNHSHHRLKKSFLLMFLIECFLFQVIPVKAEQPNRLIQTATEEEVWNGYVNLGMTKTYIDENDTLKDVQEKIKKSCLRFGVHIYNDNQELISGKYPLVRGSAFVINIDADYLYLATNRHACSDNESPRLKYYPCFIDEELNEICKKYNVEGTLLGKTKDSELGDFAIIRMDISQVPYEYKTLFKSVPINKDTINSSVGTKGYFYHIEKNRSYALREFSVLTPVPEFYIEDFIDKFYLQTTGNAVNGNSGSFCFDSKGNLMGITTGLVTGLGKKASYMLKPEFVLEGYEKIVGSPLE